MSPSRSPSPSRWYLHVGLQKTGTTYLQRTLWTSQEEVHRQGVDLVPSTVQRTFRLRLDVTGGYRPASDPPEVAHAVERLPEELREAAGVALTTEETLAGANDAQIARLLAAGAGREVHVVLTVRDLGRQLPSAWQQGLQAGGITPYPRSLDRLRATVGEDHPRWTHRDAAGVLERWARHVPSDRIHVVTVPPAGSDPAILLARFCDLLGLDHRRLDPPASAGKGNAGLPWEQAEVLRRVNAALPPDMRRREVYGDHGKRFFARQVLAPRPGTRITVPMSYREWCLDLARDQIARIRAGGYDVVGALEDLVPDEAAFGDLPEIGDAEVAEAAVEAIAEMLLIRMRRAQERHGAVPDARSAPRSRWRIPLPTAKRARR